jgi:glycosyltransferase involved in cell wall biosynthesis
MARVLYLTQVLPYPLNTGARVRQYYVLRHICQHHDVTLVSFVRADDRPEHVAHLRSVCQAVHTVPMRRSRWRDGRAIIKGLSTAQPFVIVRDEIAEMQTTLDRLLGNGKFDLVHADQVSMAQYGLMGRDLRRVLDLHNAMYLVTERLADHEPHPLKRLITRREARALARYEAQLCGQYDQVVFVTDEDRHLIEAQAAAYRVSVPADRFVTIPICVDPGDKPLIEPVARPHRITALGVMFWPPNAEGVLWFARHIWPKVQSLVPEACLTVVGKNPPPALTELNGHDQIEVVGFVPDLAHVLAETAVFIVPLRAGGGMRVKILDTWCWGLPIVSTSIGAEGIAIRNGENIMIADTADDFAQAVMRVLGDPQLASDLRRNGRQWIEEHYDWRRVYAAWDDVYGQLLRTPN